MDGYDASTYGARWAPHYDDRFGAPAEALVSTLAELAGVGRALELGVGTGRVALPLAQAGVTVVGLDASPEMLDRLRAKPGGADLDLVLGDMGTIDVDAPFSLVYAVFNTFFGLLTQDAQVRCFERVGEMLEPGGRFVVEAFVPDLGRFDRGQHLGVAAVRADGVDIDASIHDPATQRVDAQIITLGDGGIVILPVSIRYCWPSELDLMARLANLRLEHRWADWSRGPFTSASGSHVSVFRNG